MAAELVVVVVVLVGVTAPLNEATVLVAAVDRGVEVAVVDGVVDSPVAVDPPPGGDDRWDVSPLGVAPSSGFSTSDSSEASESSRRREE